MPNTHRKPVRKPTPGPAKTPLHAALAFVFTNSLGTGVVTSGIFFLTREAYGFSDTTNYTLAAAFALTYIVGALGIGPFITQLAVRDDRVTHRAVLATVMLVLAAVCFLPWATAAIQGPDAAWAVWVLAVVYGPVTGALWPLVEAFLCGERGSAELRLALGAFNIVWSGALVVAFWLMAPLLEHHPLVIIALLGVAHLACLPMLRRFPATPGRHVHDEHEAHPPVYHGLLKGFQLMLPASYVLYSSVVPFMPGALERMHVDIAWQTPLASVWLTARVVAFALLGRFHHWHGRWSAAFIGGAACATGYTLAVLAPRVFDPGAVGVAVFTTGLAVFGLGMGVIYTGAIYYAMAVGNAAVDAGGKHEALIGFGYLAGPVIMLAATGIIAIELLPTDAFEWAVAAISGLFIASIGVRVLRARRDAQTPAISGDGEQTAQSAHPGGSE